MKNILPFFVFAFFSLFFAQHSEAQCYVRLEDASGVNTDAYQDTLQKAAAKLCAIFDSTGFAGKFKVYDFGFYLHQENTTGGYPEPFAKKITEVQDSSPYYLLFGKQTDKNGIYTKFWVDLVLPDTGRFECLNIIDPAFKNEFYNKTKITTNLIFQEMNKSMEKYDKVEIATMDTICNILKSVFNCCDPSLNRSGNCQLCWFTPNEIKKYFEEKGFLSIEVGLVPEIMRGDTINNTIESKVPNNIVLHDYANEIINVFNGQYNIGQAVYQGFLNYPPENIDIKILVSDNITFCSNFSEIDYEVTNNSDEVFICMHIWRENASSNSGLLFYKIKEMTSGAFVYPEAFVCYDDPDLSALVDFQIVKTYIEQIYKNNSLYLPVNVSDSDPLNKEDCWIKVVNKTATSGSLYYYPGLSNFESDATTSKINTFANYKSCMEPNLNKTQNSYRVGYVIAHEFLHQLLKKSYQNIFTGFNTRQGNLFNDPYGPFFNSSQNYHFDCWLNLNMSGIKTQKYWPSQAGEFPEVEKILDSHKMLLNENQRLMHWKTALGTNSVTFKLIALEFSVKLTGALGYGIGYERYLFDNCIEPSSTFDECNCGF